MMSITVAPDQENMSNISSLPAKNGVMGLQSSTKKKALADVKNTLHQRFTAKGATSKNETVKHYKYENSEAPVKIVSSGKTTNSDRSAVDGDVYVDICSCPESRPQDDYEDILFKNIKFSKNQIENLSMEWEKTPVLNQTNKRELDLPEAASFDIDYSLIDMHWSSQNQIIQEDFKVPPPELDDILAEFF